MEKIILPLWKPDAVDGDDFREQLLALGEPLLADDSVRGLRLAVADGAVAAAGHRRMCSNEPLPDGLLSAWVDQARERAALEAALAPVVDHFECYLVTEAEPLVNRTHLAVPGQRGYGMCQVVFLERPPRLTEQEWLEIWQGSHTRVAIDTQSTFGYRQNVIVRPLTQGARPYAAMIEEHFPPEAMASDDAFYAAGGDAGLLQDNMQAMMDSCARFIDFDKIDVIPMSDYLIRPVAP